MYSQRVTWKALATIAPTLACPFLVTHDPLELPATPVRVHAAAEAAGLSGRALERALRIATATPDPAAWRRFLSRTLALLGAGLVLAGVVCFFAYNWEYLGRFAKLGLIEGGIVVATLVGWRTLPRLSGQLALTGAAVLVGPLLAVYGQTYQTGADPYGLFLTWVVLIAPWVVAARFSALWVVAVVLLDLALTLFWSQVVAADGRSETLTLPLLIALVHAAAVAAWEWQIRRPSPWLTERWAPHKLALVAYGSLFIAAAAFVIDPDGAHSGVNVAGAVGLVGLAASIAGTFSYYRRVRLDRFMVTAAGAAGLALVAVFVGRLILVDLDLEELGLLLIAFFVIAEITFGLRWLRQVRPPRHEPGV